jgi:site-specific DNA-methyltransferase (adenine-specific)
LNIVHLCDCMDFMRGKPDKAYDLAICDPPYGIERYKAKDGGNSNKIKSFGDLDKNWNNDKPNKIYFDELFRISKNQIIWGGNNFTLPESEYFIIWDKNQMMPSFAQCEFAWTNCNIPAKIYRFRSQSIERINPAQKPVALYKWLLKNYAKPGQTIFDSHVGSGSSRIACYDMGFDFEGCELDADYHAAQEKRFVDHIAQQDLFDKKDIQKEIYREKDLI